MRITFTSVNVDDQDLALAFYTDKLGFVVSQDVPLGEHRWITVVSPEDRRLVGLGVIFTQPPVVMRPVTTAVLDDTCGNLIQIATMV